MARQFKLALINEGKSIVGSYTPSTHGQDAGYYDKIPIASASFAKMPVKIKLCIFSPPFGGKTTVVQECYRAFGLSDVLDGMNCEYRKSSIHVVDTDYSIPLNGNIVITNISDYILRSEISVAIKQSEDRFMSGLRARNLPERMDWFDDMNLNVSFATHVIESDDYLSRLIRFLEL